MPVVVPFASRWFGTKGAVKRPPRQQIALAVRILDQRHAEDVAARSWAHLGDRASVVGQPDTAFNALLDWVTRVGKAYTTPPLVSELEEELAAVIGDHSASTTIQRYGTADGRPLPTGLVTASSAALRYRIGVGYAGAMLGWSPRTGRLYQEVVTPDDLALEYASDDPSEPTVIRHRAIRSMGEKQVEVVEVYDLTDLDRPRFYIERERDGTDITGDVIDPPAEGWYDEWRYSDGRPFHRIVITGNDRNPYATNSLVEGTLILSVRWTAWGAATDDAGYPQRNVRGLVLRGMDSDTDTTENGLSTGPETILRWDDVDPERPGTHWQDGPGYDPLIIAKSNRLYHMGLVSTLGIPVDMEGTGGEPTETERKAVEELIQATYPECRRFDSELIRRCAAMANRLPEVDGDDFDEGPRGVLYREEVVQALGAQVEQIPPTMTAEEGDDE